MVSESRTVLITGAAGGIGWATACLFATEGASLVLADLLPFADRQVGELTRLGATAVVTHPCDVSKEREVEGVCKLALDRFGRLDVIVNVAGMMIYRPLEELTEQDWLQVTGVNLLSVAYFTKHGFLRMKSGSAIVNVSSVHALQSTPQVASYAAAKAGMLALTRAAAIEGRPKGIRCNAVLPGAVDTPMLWNNPNIRSGAEQIDSADVGKPEEIAAAIRFLASHEASFITGASLAVDGGRLAQL
ncbi:MAG TPA: SDR family oxidoreductase [Magnetospirillaceae bacterium]|nr:SDR family oxidoreductase [Magnetospirillaceae bacterium]